MTTATDKAAAAKDIKRFIGTLKNLDALANEIEDLASIENTIRESQTRLEQLQQHEGAWRSYHELKAALPEVERLQERLVILRRIANIEEAETAVTASLAEVESKEAAARARLAELDAKVSAAGATLADLEQRVNNKQAELSEISAGLRKLQLRLVG